MSEYGMLFQPAMARAAIDGFKTVTRRAIKLPPDRGAWEKTIVGGPGVKCNGLPFPETAAVWNTTTGKTIASPYGTTGDTLWMRENCFYTRFDANLLQSRDFVKYMADGNFCPKRDAVGRKWRPSIHMHRWACRQVLKILTVDVERLQDITDDDCIAEGIKKLSKDGGITWKYGIADTDGEPGGVDIGWRWSEWCNTPRDAFKKLICDINGQEAWDENPFVWVIRFKKIKDKWKPYGHL